MLFWDHCINHQKATLEKFNENLECLLKIKKERIHAFNINTLYELDSSSTLSQDFMNIFSTFAYHTLVNLPTRNNLVLY